MTCTREDLEIIKDAVQAAIADGRQMDDSCKTPQATSTNARLLDACGRLASDPAPVLLQALGGYVLLCLLRSDVAAMKADREIRKLMDL